jgi:ribose transport system ATP-binding protein
MARLLQHDVDVLLLDEPTRGIDVAAKALVYKLINALATGGEAVPALRPAGILPAERNKGKMPSPHRQPKAVLMVSSYLPELMGVCDRVAVMCRGRLGPTHRIDEVNEHDLMLEATGQIVVSEQ